MAGGLLLLAACGAGTESSSASENTAEVKAEGRYLEEQLSIPRDLTQLLATGQTKEGALLLFGMEDMRSLSMWRSDDDGDSWKKQALPWVTALTDIEEVNFAGIDRDGGLYLNYRQAASGQEPEGTEGPQVFLHGTADGVVTTLPFTVSSDLFFSWMTTLKVTNSGDLFLNAMAKLSQVNGQTGMNQNVYDPDTAVTGGSFVPFGDLLALGGPGSIQIYDAKKGEIQEEIPCPSGIEIEPGNTSSYVYAKRMVAVSADEKTIYFCDATGIYSAALGGAAVERLVDGELTSLNMPSIQMLNFFSIKDNRFLVLYQSAEGYELLRYHYDATVSTVPSQELKIYSLRDNPTVRQAMSLFQRANPEVRVIFKTGMDENGEITRSDALRTLSTELLAGKGPDLLVLDDIPADSYIEQGALLDLEPVLEQRIKDGRLLSNVLESYRRDGKLYGAPARFSVPVILGEGTVINSLHNLSDLADWLEQNPEASLYCNVPEHLLQLLYPVYAPALFGKDGKGEVDQDMLTQLLSDLDRISGDKEKFAGAYLAGRADDAVFGGIRWLYDNIGLNIATIRSYTDIAASYSVVEKSGKGNYAPLEGIDGPAFIPGTALAISANSANTDAAKAFLNFTLSDEVLGYSFDDGLPVSRTALEMVALQMSQNGEDQSYGASVTDEDGTELLMSLDLKWPPVSYAKEIMDAFGKIETSSPVNNGLLQILTDETASYFLGEKSLESTVETLMQKLDLYRSE